MAEPGPVGESDGDQWKKPEDVMKKIRLRKKNKIAGSTIDAVTSKKTRTVSQSHANKQIKNPFAKKRSSSESTSNGKKRILSLSSPDNDPECEPNQSATLLEFSAQNRLDSLSFLEQDKDDDDDLSNNDLGIVYLSEDSIQGILGEGSKVAEGEKWEPSLPTDWSLKTKARFLSPSSFAWCARMRGTEEAESVMKATRCQPFLYDSPQQSDLRVELGKWLIYWQFPCIPWFSLFPRFGIDCKIQPHSISQPIPNESAKASLYDSWITAFRSAYQMLRSDLCPFFYVCSQQYTALFRSADVGSEISCLLTPTSLGFRNSLKAEGIPFSMPLADVPAKAEQAIPSDEKCDTTPMDNPGTTASSSSSSSFVQSLKEEGSLMCPFPASRPGTLSDKDDSAGGSKDLLKEDNKKVSEKCSEEDEFCESGPEEELDAEEELSWKNISDELQFRKSKEITFAATNDGLPKTAVLVEGPMNTQMLFNYLLNTRSSTTTSGPQCGIPPTILSPVAFAGSTLLKLDYKAGIAQTSDIRPRSQRRAGTCARSSLQQSFSLDVAGPLMPHHVFSIISLLTRTQDDGEFSAAFSTYTHTVPFNAGSAKDAGASKMEEAEATAIDKCGLPYSCVKQLSSNKSTGCLRQVTVTRSGYSWSH